MQDFCTRFQCYALALLELLCAATAPAAETVTHTKLGCEITFPDGWTEDMHPPGELARRERHVKSVRNSAHITVRVSYELEEGFTAREIADAYIARIKNSDEFRIAECKVGGADGYRATFNEGQSHCVHCFVVSGRRLYSIEAHVQKPDYDASAAEIDSVIQSFKLLDAK